MFCLKPNDLVQIVMPASGCSKEVLQSIQQFLEQQWNLRCAIPDPYPTQHLLFPGNDHERAELLLSALSDPHTQAVWMALGGYGSARLIPYLQKAKPIVQKKCLIAYSDLTAVNLFLQQEWGWQILHAPAARQLPLKTVDEVSIHALHDALFEGKFKPYSLQPLNTLAKEAILHATITGGNLSILQTSIGTAWQLNARDKIVFIEETNERIYRLDRMLIHLQQANLFHGAKAIIFGDTTLPENEPESLWQKVLADFVSAQTIPVFQMNGFGHAKQNFPLLLNAFAKIEQRLLKIGTAAATFSYF